MTDQQREILRLVDSGLSFKQVQKKLALPTRGAVARAVYNRKHQKDVDRIQKVYIHNTTVRLDDPMLKFIDGVAQDLKVSRSETIRTLIEWAQELVDKS